MKSLNKIFKSFRKTLADLDEFIYRTEEEIDKNEIKMANIQSDNITHRRSISQADNARSKIADLIGDE